MGYSTSETEIQLQVTKYSLWKWENISILKGLTNEWNKRNKSFIDTIFEM